MKITCPTCQKTVEWDKSSPWRPFCSERCKLIDLGDWLTEKHVIADNSEEHTSLTLNEADQPIH